MSKLVFGEIVWGEWKPNGTLGTYRLGTAIAIERDKPCPGQHTVHQKVYVERRYIETIDGEQHE